MKTTAIKNNTTTVKTADTNKNTPDGMKITAKNTGGGKVDPPKEQQKEAGTAAEEPVAVSPVDPTQKGSSTEPALTPETDTTAAPQQDNQRIPSLDTSTTNLPEAGAGEQPSTHSAEIGTAPTELRKPARNLDQTIEILEDLTRKKRHRDNLLAIINKLEAFEIELQDDPDPTSDSNFSGCTLTIKNVQHDFSTQNANLIYLVALFIKSSCADKLAEIEATIVIPD